MTERTEGEARDPKALGRYTIERVLGEGGMGRVYLARDSVLGRLVAVKIVRPDLDLDPEIVATLGDRMRHEARAAAAVVHPAIVTLHDMGVDDEVGVYLVFEYVDAESLRARVTRTGALSLHEIPRLARELGAALTLAHEAGVIHRDVKPENVLLSRHGPQLADFGVARVPESKLTQRGTILGTPAYSAPEALANGSFSPASDQFSLAATLYEAATGRRAFGGSDAIAVAEAVATAAPPALERDLGPNPARIEALERALSRGLAKQPQDRFRSCTELADAIARAIEGPLSATDPIRTPAPAPAPAPEPPAPSVAPTVPARASDRPPESARFPMGREQSQRITLTPQEDDRPSVILRARTKRAQNIVAAIAVLVIVALAVFGRDRAHRHELADEADASADASTRRAKAPSAPKRRAEGPPETAQADAGPAPDAGP